MTRRLCWILLHLAGGLAALPGCGQTFFGDRRWRNDDPALARVKNKEEPTVTVEYPFGGTPTPSDSSTKPKNNQREEVPPPRLSSFRHDPPTEPKDAGIRPAALAGPEAEQPRPRAVKARPPLVEALHCMLEDRHQEALQHLNAYDQETQEFFLQFLPTLTLFAKKHWNEITTQEIGVVDEQLRGVLTKLRPRTELKINKVCYCKEVRAFGVYESLPGNHAFVAAAADRPGERVFIYIEPGNFASEQRGDIYETKLTTTFEIHDAQGKLRHQFASNDNKYPIRAQSPVHDYFGVHIFCVPELEPGVYQLTVQVVDETIPNAPRQARKSLDFRVTGGAGQPLR